MGNGKTGESNVLVGQQVDRPRTVRRSWRALALSLALVVGFGLPTLAPSSAKAADPPTVVSLSPGSGPAAGNTTFDITGTGFVEDQTTVTVGGVAAAVVVTSTTSLTVTTPARATTQKTVGAQAVVVTVNGVASNADKTYTYRPVLGTPGTSRVWLHDLASRSQRQSIVRTQTAPFLVSGTDSRTNESYLYQTDVLYPTTTGFHIDAYSRESDERESSFTATALTSGTPFTGESIGDQPNQLTGLKSGGTCTNTNNFGGATTYCSVFGPEVYTETFYGRAGQSLSFEWRAKKVSDDYEIYAFLVAVDDDSPISYAASNELIGATGTGTGRNAPGYDEYVARHTLVTHSLGRSPSSFFTTSAAIPADGLYRFRFVNGSYDATGGFVLGSEMYIRNTILVGTTNTITVNDGNPLGDQVGSGSPPTYSPYVFNVSATSGAAVSASATGKCTVATSGANPTVVTVTNSSGAGDCTLLFSQGASGEFAPAEDVTRKFSWLAAATFPQAPTISSVTPGNQSLSVAFLNPAGDGGAPIFNYEYSTNNGGTWVALDPQSTTSPIVIAGLTNGTTYTVRIRARNSVDAGTPSGSSTGTPAATAPGAPTITLITPADESLSVAFSAPENDGGSTITNYQYSTNNGATWVLRDPSAVTSPLIIDSLTNGTAYQVRIRAVNNSGAGAQSAMVPGTPALPAPPAATSSPPPAVTPLATVLPQRVVPTTVPPAPVTGPVARANPTAPAPNQPTATVGGQTRVLQTQVTDQNSVSLRSGAFNIGVNIQPGQGSIRQNPGGNSTELEVRNGGSTALAGSGVLPGSTVQVFMPMSGNDSKELARIPVDATGSFSGDALFGSRPTERPLPIGRHVMQIVSVDTSGQQAVVEMAVNIAQPAPAPEIDRSLGQAPTLSFGQFVATNGGDPEVVTVTPQPDQKQATIQGDSWSMSVSIPGQGGAVAEADQGEVLVEFIRNESALVAGSGFMPGTRADVWLFSDPTLLGSVMIDENGEFNGEVNVDGNVVTVGEHTLQLQGVGTDGFVRSANLGVVVNDTEVAAATEEAAASFLWLLWLIGGLVAIVAAGLLWQWRRRVA